MAQKKDETEAPEAVQAEALSKVQLAAIAAIVQQAVGAVIEEARADEKEGLFKSRRKGPKVDAEARKLKGPYHPEKNPNGYNLLKEATAVAKKNGHDLEWFRDPYNRGFFSCKCKVTGQSGYARWVQAKDADGEYFLSGMFGGAGIMADVRSGKARKKVAKRRRAIPMGDLDLIAENEAWDIK